MPDVMPIWLVCLLAFALIEWGFAENKLDEASIHRHVHFHKILVGFGNNLGKHVEGRLLSHLQQVSNTHVELFDGNHDEDSLLRAGERERELARNFAIVLFGNNSLFSTVCEKVPESITMKAESFKIIVDHLASGSYLFCVDGEPLSNHRHQNLTFDTHAVSYGAVTGSYSLLELLGFGFLHPLQPYVPPILRLGVVDEDFHANGTLVRKVTYEEPYWPERGFHIHTQHPLELTEVLQGHDIPQFGPHGPQCQQFSKRSYRRTPRFPLAGSEAHQSENVNDEQHFEQDHDYCERWEDMVIDVDYFFEWSVANRLNKVEWLLLGNYKWGDEFQTRQQRLRKLVDLAHAYSLLVGVDVPIGNIQQHGWSMVNVRLPLREQFQQIRDRVDWILRIGFDFLTTESGLSEFTHPECDLMLDLLNVFAETVNGTWGRECAIKVHCSTGQHCESHLDPRTGDLLNFNFLPMYAHPGLGVFPHTVQMYALDDPIGGAYGNQNFSYVEDYLVYEAKQGQRSVMFYGETAYWVSVDVDVPLFLPIYGQRRLRDLFKIARREQREGFRMDGQMNFDSGWEWGYWLVDVVTARASWDPFIGRSRLPEVDNIVNEDGEWDAFAASITPFTRLFGPQYETTLGHLLVSLSKLQADSLIFGKVQGRPSPDLSKLSGIAYLSGFDTWSELPRLLKLAMTQPNKVFLRETSDPLWPYVLELLEDMEKNFHSIHDNMDTLFQAINASSISTSVTSATLSETTAENFLIDPSAVALLHEIRDAVEMLWLRSKHVLLLYDSKQAQTLQLEALSSGESPLRYRLLTQAREVLQQATAVVARRETYYRVHWARIAAWRDNPTVYRFGYLWSVHSLYYWWRDQGLAEESPYRTPHSPCYLNRMDSTEVAVGWGKATLEFLRVFINRYTPFASLYPLEIVNCLSASAKEYEFPRDLHVPRPVA